MCEGRNLRIVDEAGFAEEEVGDSLGHRRGEHCADVDRHVEKAESGIPLGGVFRVVVEVAHHHLEVAFEQSRADGDQGKGAEHQDFPGQVRRGRYGEAEISEEHHSNSDGYASSVSDLVGEHSSEQRHEVHARQEN